MAILIVGGAGYIGSYINHVMNINGFETIVLDNLTTGKKHAVNAGTLVVGDYGDAALLEKIFTSYTIDAVMHFAAFTSVSESLQNPGTYYHNNVCNTLTLLKAMVSHNVKRILFSSSAAIFGASSNNAIDENHRAYPLTPYGKTKLAVEEILKDYDIAYGIKSCSLRYFNVAGGDPAGTHKNYNATSSNLIPQIFHAIRERSPVMIFGIDYDTIDGTCVRDYIHIHDLARAQITALQKLLNGAPSSIYNLGNGEGYTVRQVIAASKIITGVDVAVIEKPRRDGDPTLLIANPAKARKELSWAPVYRDLVSIISHQWRAIP